MLADATIDEPHASAVADWLRQPGSALSLMSAETRAEIRADVEAALAALPDWATFVRGAQHTRNRIGLFACTRPSDALAVLKGEIRGHDVDTPDARRAFLRGSPARGAGALHAVAGLRGGVRARRGGSRLKELDIGIIGLGVMGQNLALNIADHGFSVGGWDAWPDRSTASRRKAAGEPRARRSRRCPSCVAALRRPRRIIMLVKAGEVVDQTIAALRPLLGRGDMLIDGGNEHFRNTERRAAELAADGHPLLRHGRVGRRGRARATARR